MDKTAARQKKYGIINAMKQLEVWFIDVFNPERRC